MILALFFICLLDGCFENPAPTLQSCYKIFFMLKYILIIKNVCERLFDELVKEWFKNRYSIISGTFRVIDGRKVRVRKSHLRRKR